MNAVVDAVLNQVAKHSPAKYTCLSAFVVCVAMPALGQALPAPTVSADAAVSAGALAGATGVIAINEAAGVANAQSNATVIAINTAGLAASGTDQSTRTKGYVSSARATIAANAFSYGAGVISVNQAAGIANLQRNSVVLGAASAQAQALTDSELSAVAPRNQPFDNRTGTGGMREASIADDAFQHTGGIVQVNQSAGAGNTTANSFVLRPPAGTLF
jgi:hypothetical protein